VRADIERILAEPNPGGALLRLIVTRGGRRIAMLEALPVLAKASHSRASPTHRTRARRGQVALYAANMLACGSLGERRFDEACSEPAPTASRMPDGVVLCGRGGRDRHPALSERILDSIIVHWCSRLADVDEQPITVDELESIDEAFIASSVAEVMPVRRID